MERHLNRRRATTDPGVAPPQKQKHGSPASWRAQWSAIRGDYHASRHEGIDSLLQPGFIEALFELDQERAHAVMEAIVAYEDMFEWHRELPGPVSDTSSFFHPVAYLIVTFVETQAAPKDQRLDALVHVFQKIVEHAVAIESALGARLPAFWDYVKTSFDNIPCIIQTPAWESLLDAIKWASHHPPTSLTSVILAYGLADTWPRAPQADPSELVGAFRKQFGTDSPKGTSPDAIRKEMYAMIVELSRPPVNARHAYMMSEAARVISLL